MNVKVILAQAAVHASQTARTKNAVMMDAKDHAEHALKKSLSAPLMANAVLNVCQTAKISIVVLMDAMVRAETV